jgi:putative membrane protein
VRFFLRLVINAVALWVAVQLIPGITYTGGWLAFLGVAIVFGLLNAFLRPIVKLLTCPLLILTLGLFTLVINALMLWLTSAFSGALDLEFHVAGFWAAFWGALVVSLVSFFLSIFLAERELGAER